MKGKFTYLKGLIVANYGSVSKYAKTKSKTVMLNNKLSGRVKFNIEDMNRLIKDLKLNEVEIYRCFFMEE